MGARLLGLASLLARRHGTAAAQALLRSGRAWMADPANEARRRELLEELRGWADRAGGAAGRLSARLARELERRRVSVGAWERDLMSLRYEIADMAPGPMREAALAAYVAQAGAGVHLIGSARHPETARRQVLEALRAEARQLAGERLSAAEREAAMDAVDGARRAAGEPAGAAAR